MQQISRVFSNHFSIRAKKNIVWSSSQSFKTCLLSRAASSVGVASYDGREGSKCDQKYSQTPLSQTQASQQHKSSSSGKLFLSYQLYRHSQRNYVSQLPLVPLLSSLPQPFLWPLLELSSTSLGSGNSNRNDLSFQVQFYETCHRGSIY